ncbi:Uncharacterized protein K3495_g5082 [Podosphaera aphanis]|nr:Uncharacterized protein K3495_g5082 [Podosphaera aphanis]
MTATTIEEYTTKRKRKSSITTTTSKRARSESSDNADQDEQAQILLLENEIFKSKKNYNNITTLIQLFESNESDEDTLTVSGISLCRVFTRFMASGDMSKGRSASEKEIVVTKWLKERYFKYKEILISLLMNERLSITILTLCLKLLKTEGQYLQAGAEYSFPTPFLTSIIRVLLYPGCDTTVRKNFGQKFMEEYDDIRFYALEAIDKIISADEGFESSNVTFHNVLELLTSIESIPESKEEIEDFYLTEPPNKNHLLYSLTQHKKRAQNAWLALIKFELNKYQRKSILRVLVKSIVPWFIKPELLMDFLVDSYDLGGSTSLLALSGVFYLIQEKNLDYPSFYKKLYSLLDANLLHSKHRSMFFRLLDTFLGSTHLPAVLVASFIKRLSRLSLNAPPSGIVAVVPWIYNLLRKHPTCTFMMHRVTKDPESISILKENGMSDPYLMDEKDPMETNAIESSLWEIVMLQSHYHPNVATLAKIISEQFTKSSYNIEDFLDHSYGSMLEAETSKDIKKIPTIEFEIPKRIFMEHEPGSNMENSLLVKLWKFS